MNTNLLTAVCAAAVLSGCGHLGKGMANDAEMLDKAEFATGIDRSQLSVVPGSAEGQIDSVHFRVKSLDGQMFRCCYTTMLVMKSDALCTPIDKTGKAFEKQKSRARKDGNCNALLRAAGRC